MPWWLLLLWKGFRPRVELYHMWVCWFKFSAIITVFVVVVVVVVKGTVWLTLTGEKRFHPRVVLHQRLHQGSKSQTGCDPPPHITVIEIAWLDPHWRLLNFSQWRWFLRWKSSSVWHVVTLDIEETFVEIISQFSHHSALSAGDCALRSSDFVHLVRCPQCKKNIILCSQLQHTLLRLLSLEIGWGGLRSQIPVSVSHLTTRSRPSCRVGSQTFLLCPSTFNWMEYQSTRCKVTFQCRSFNRNSYLLSIHI